METQVFGLYLRGLRNSKKMSIRQLALYSGVSNAYLSHVENGKRSIPSPEILKKLSKPLGVEYVELMEKAGYLEEVKLLKGMLNKEIGVRAADPLNLSDKASLADIPIFMGDVELTLEMKKKLVDLAELVFDTSDIPSKKK